MDLATDEAPVFPELSSCAKDFNVATAQTLDLPGNMAGTDRDDP
jgi:hypothetical protein